MTCKESNSYTVANLEKDVASQLESRLNKNLQTAIPLEEEQGIISEVKNNSCLSRDRLGRVTKWF